MFNSKNPALIFVAAPSGAGKNSFIDKALKDFSELEEIITYTTRPPRSGEDQKSYHFISSERFEELVKINFFVEFSQVHGSFYGTSKESIEKIGQKSLGGIVDLDVQGVEKMTKLYPEALRIFILPPSIEELRRRIVLRDRGKAINLDLRLENAKKEIEKAHLYDYQIVNQDFETSYKGFKKIVEAFLKK